MANSCGQCKNTVSKLDKFCSNCGAALPGIKVAQKKFLKHLEQFLGINSFAIQYIEKDHKENFSSPVGVFYTRLRVLHEIENFRKFCQICENLLDVDAWQFGDWDDETFMCPECMYFLITKRTSWIKPVESTDYFNNNVIGAVICDSRNDFYFIDRVFEITNKKQFRCLFCWDEPNSLHIKGYLPVGTEVYEVSQITKKFGQESDTVCEECIDVSFEEKRILVRTKNFTELERTFALPKAKSKK